MLRTNDGIILEMYPSSVMDKSYFRAVNSGHELILQSIDQLAPGNVFVDVGANIGYFSFIASRKVGPSGRVFSFEPSQREFGRLQRAVPLNQHSNITAFNIALAESAGQVKLSIDSFHTGLNQIQYEQNAQQTELIACKRLDEVLHDQYIDLLKVDVEGAEMKVLRGCEELLQKGQIQKLIVEITPAFLNRYGDSKEDLYKYLESYGMKPTIESDEWQFDEVFVLTDYSANVATR